MNRYTIELRPAARRDLRRIESKDLERITETIDRLADNPRPAGCLKMKGGEGYYRVRVGNYRIVYDIRDNKLIILVVRVRKRKEAYR